jgi:hypothetical protein
MKKVVNQDHWHVLWPDEEAVRVLVEWANFPQHGKVNRVLRALRACDDVLAIGAYARPYADDFPSGSVETARRWLSAAIDSRPKLASSVVRDINVELEKLQGVVKPYYGKRGLRERFVDFRPRPLSWAALGAALIADKRTWWHKRVGRCLYHTDRFVFNEPYEGQRGPLRKFYCSSGCKVMASRRRHA